VTRALLGDVRTELLERIDQARNEFQAGILGLRGDVNEARASLGSVAASVSALKTELKADNHRLEAGLHEVKAEVARVAFLVEEQNVRNKVVLDALVAFIERQGRLEQRIDDVEGTMRRLASGQAGGAA
jgi:hypothetical protein